MNTGRTISISLFIIGIAMCLTSATLLFFDLVPVPLSIVILIIGIGLMGLSNFRLLE